MNPQLRPALFVALSLLASACNCGAVGSEEDARLAYLGLDRAIDRALNLGFAGFNAASSANIPPQNAPGELGGTMQIAGQVDQGSSANKGMRLTVELVGYRDAAPEDGVEIVYDRAEGELPALNLNLKDIPNGTLTGTLVGSFLMSGNLEDVVTLNLTFSGQTEGTNQQDVKRKSGTTRITGTATSQYGEYAVDLTR